MITIQSISGSNELTVSMTNHGAFDGDFVYISDVTSAIGGIPLLEINKEHEIFDAASSSFKIAATTVASSTQIYEGSLKLEFNIYSGRAIAEYGYGWSTGAWGRLGWGTGNSLPIVLPPRLYTQDRYDDDLIFNIRNGDIYYWTYDDTFTTRAVKMEDLPGANSVPLIVGSILFSQQDRHLLAFGCTNYGTGTYDPLLIRWADQDLPWDWEPTTTNSAGFLRVTNGSEIVRAVRTRQEILVFTDSTLYSLQFLGTSEVFGLQEYADNISVASQSCFATVNNITFWMGSDKFYFYNGRVDTLPCTLRQYIFQDINKGNLSQIVCGTNEQFNEIIWFYPSANSTEINRYVIYNYQENLWYYGNLVRTAWLDSPLRDFPQAAGMVGYIYNHESGNDADGAPMTAYIQSGDIDISDGDQFMLLRRVIPDINFINSTGNSPNVNLTVSPRNFPGSAFATNNVEGTGLTKNVSRSTTVPVDQYTNEVFIRARGRQIAFKIQSDSLGTQWQLGMPRIDARADGRKS